jgi:hypothetical protein
VKCDRRHIPTPKKEIAVTAVSLTDWGGQFMFRRYLSIIVGFLAIVACDAAESAQYAIPRVRDVETKTGAPVLIFTFIDCKAHAPFEGTAFVQHGKVSMRRTTINQCGNPKEPANAYWYTSDPGFKGIDEANFSYVSGSVLIVHITVR